VGSRTIETDALPVTIVEGMSGKAADRYKQVRANTSTPGELLLALYDGLFRFLNGAKVCFENQQAARGREFVGKAHAVVSELLLALDHAASPELCGNLAAVYDFALSRLSDANRDATPKPLEDVLRALTPLREAWALAVPKAIAEANAKKGG
jgi:flagellar secretion chaperone FliS